MRGLENLSLLCRLKRRNTDPEKIEGFIEASKRFFLERLFYLDKIAQDHANLRDSQRWYWVMMKTLRPAIANGELGIVFIYPPRVGPQERLTLEEIKTPTVNSLFLVVDAEWLATLSQDKISQQFDEPLAKAANQYRLRRPTITNLVLFGYLPRDSITPAFSGSTRFELVYFHPKSRLFPTDRLK